MATLKLKKYANAEEWISQEYPDLFHWPMAVGTGVVLLSMKPKGVSRRSLTKYLRKMTEKSIDYHNVIIENDNRYQLDGSILGEVKPHHKDRAEILINKLIKKEERRNLENNKATH